MNEAESFQAGGVLKLTGSSWFLGFVPLDGDRVYKYTVQVDHRHF